MRAALFSATLVLLLAGLIGLWSYRFERMPGSQGLNLADLKNPTQVLPPGAAWIGDGPETKLHLRIPPDGQRLSLSLALPDFPAMEALHIRFSMAARELRLGPQKWDDGRVLIEWRSPDETTQQEVDPVCSLRDTESRKDTRLVVRSRTGNSIPVLRIEHLGRSGEFEISQLELIPVQERELWIFGRWVLLALFFAWLWRAITGAIQTAAWRPLLAVCIWLGMAICFAIPGPWKTLRPLLTNFEIGEVIIEATPDGLHAHSHASTYELAKPNHRALTTSSLGRIPVQGGWILQLKQKLALLRPLLHAVLLFVPTVVFAFLIGPRLALALSFALAISSEAAQTAFGFGFEWIDVLDLLTDSAGILSAIWCFKHLQRSGRVPQIFNGNKIQ